MYVCMHVYYCMVYLSIHMLHNVPGIQGLNLTSSQEGHYCPNTKAMFTCTARQVAAVHWYAMSKRIIAFLPNGNPPVVQDSRYIATLINVTSLVDNGNRGDIITTLQVPVDEISNGTNISCIVRGLQEHMVIYKQCKQLDLKRYYSMQHDCAEPK